MDNRNKRYRESSLEGPVVLDNEMGPPDQKKMKLTLEKRGESSTLLDTVTPTDARVITFPDKTIEVNKAEDLTGTTLAPSITNSSISQFGPMTQALDMNDNHIQSIGNLEHSAGDKEHKTQSGDKLVFKEGENVYMEANPSAFTALKLFRSLDTNNQDIVNGGSTLISATTIGGGVVNSNLQNLGTQNENLDMGGNSVNNTSEVNINQNGNLDLGIHRILFQENEASNTMDDIHVIGNTFKNTIQTTITDLNNLNTINVNHPTGAYNIDSASVITKTGLGSTVHNSGLKNLGVQDATLDMGTQDISNAKDISAQTVDLTSGNSYSINSTNVLSTDTLGSTVTTSSLKTTGVLEQVKIKEIEVTNADSPVYWNGSDTSVMLCDTSAGSITINLPVSASNANTMIWVKDKGNAGTNSINLAKQSGDRIDDQTNYFLTTDYESVTLFTKGDGKWWIV